MAEMSECVHLILLENAVVFLEVDLCLVKVWLCLQLNLVIFLISLCPYALPDYLIPTVTIRLAQNVYKMRHGLECYDNDIW